MSANWNLGWLNNGVTPPYNPDRWGSDPTVAGAAQQIGAGLTQQPVGASAQGYTAYDPSNVFTGAAGWAGTPPPSDVAGRPATGGLAGQLGTQDADPTRNIGRNPDGSVVPVNHNPYGWGLAQGAGQAQAAPGVTPTAWSGLTGGHTGSTYNIAGLNPWTNLAQYNGGVYQTGGGDRGQANTPGGEDDINRVFRWTNDILKARGIAEGSPEAAQIFAANVERLKSEYAAAGANWATSKFANFGGQQQQQGQQGQGQPAPPNQGQQQQQPGQATPGQPAPLPAAGQPAVTAQTTGTPGGTGVAQNPPNGNNPGLTAAAGAYNQANPLDVVNAYLRSKGIDPNVHTMFGDFIKKQMSAIVPTIMETMFSGVDQSGNPKVATDKMGQGDMFNLLNSIFSQGSLGGNLSNYANGITGQIAGSPGLQGLAAPVMKRLLGDVNALQSYGMNPFEQQASQDQFGNAMDSYNTNAYNIANGQGGDTASTLWQFIAKNSPNLFGQGGLGAIGGYGGGGNVGAAPVRTGNGPY